MLAGFGTRCGGGEEIGHKRPLPLGASQGKCPVSRPAQTQKDAAQWDTINPRMASLKRHNEYFHNFFIANPSAQVSPETQALSCSLHTHTQCMPEPACLESFLWSRSDTCRRGSASLPTREPHVTPEGCAVRAQTFWLLSLGLGRDPGHGRRGRGATAILGDSDGAVQQMWLLGGRQRRWLTTVSETLGGLGTHLSARLGSTGPMGSPLRPRPRTASRTHANISLNLERAALVGTSTVSTQKVMVLGIGKRNHGDMRSCPLVET